MNDASDANVVLDEQTLERIAADRAAGEWNDDLEQLLAAHLSVQPQHRALVEATNDCMHLARAALRRQVEPDIPSFDAITVLRRAAWRQHMGVGLAMAACLILGLTFGLWSSPASPQHTHVAAFDAWLASATEQTADQQSNSLWSRQHWQQRLQQAQTSERPESSRNRQTFNRIFGG
ncbi:MAG: hypothetical protein IT445_20060 [Phycisphaeraceae bacterium]|nr:hypothetical protein [Phycisphaeraceae bacterium]